jgi:hypothetical protein
MVYQIQSKHQQYLEQTACILLGQLVLALKAQAEQ